MAMRTCAAAILAFAMLGASLETHPITKVVDLLAKLKDQAIEEGREEEVLFDKFQYWCSTSIDELKKVIAEEEAKIDELTSTVASLNQNKDTLTEEISELDTEIEEMVKSEEAAAEDDAKREEEYKAHKADLESTIDSIGKAIDAMTEASGTDSKLLQTKAQESVRAALALLSVKATDQQRTVLVDFAAGEPPMDAIRKDFEKAEAGKIELKAEDSGRPESKAKGGLDSHVKKYSFKSDNVIDLLKELKLNFEDELTALDTAETDGEGSYALESKAREDAKDASEKSRTQKRENLADVESDLSEAENDLKNEEEDHKADSDTHDETVKTCKTKNDEWEAVSKVRKHEIEALDQGRKILAKVAGVRTEEPSNPVPPTSPVDFLQISQPVLDAKAKAVQLLRKTAKTMHSKAIDQLALEVSTHLTGPFDKVNDMIQKMIFRLMSEQTDEDKHKAWCDLELEKTEKSKDAKTDKADELTKSIAAQEAKVGTLSEEINAADKMVADITAFMKEATEIRQTGHEENNKAIKDAKVAQTAIANAIAVLEDFYKSSGKVPKEDYEFVQTSGPGKVTLPEDPKLWDSGYTGVADPKKADTGVIAILENTAADFSKMEAKTKAQEVEDQKEYDTMTKEHKVEMDRRRSESEAKEQEKKRKVAKIESETKQLKHTNEELDAVKKYEADLQPACVDGDSSYEDRKGARSKEIKALKEAQGMLKDAFKEKAASFLAIKRHA